MANACQNSILQGKGIISVPGVPTRAKVQHLSHSPITLVSRVLFPGLRHKAWIPDDMRFAIHIYSTTPTTLTTTGAEIIWSRERKSIAASLCAIRSTNTVPTTAKYQRAHWSNGPESSRNIILV
eukprot:scaffold2974_cov181-Amphora_coffeaeformis.AAC.18